MNDEKMKTEPHTLKFFTARKPSQFERLCDVIANAVRGRVCVATHHTPAEYSALLQHYGFDTKAEGNAVLGTLHVGSQHVPFRVEVATVTPKQEEKRPTLIIEDEV